MRHTNHSDIGTVRQNNEDSCWSGVNAYNNLAGIVCDGLGGYKGGSAASDITVRVFKQRFESTDLTTLSQEQINIWIWNIIDEARTEINHHIEKNPKLANMATTFVCALVIGGKAYIYNIGDSRAWLVSEIYGCKQVTTDQNLLNYLNKMNAPHHLYEQHKENLYAITQFVGAKNSKVIKPDVYEIDLQKGDYIVLTSDGCHNFINPKDMGKKILTARDFNDVPTQIIAESLSNDSNDNLSVVILGV